MIYVILIRIEYNSLIIKYEASVTSFVFKHIENIKEIHYAYIDNISCCPWFTFIFWAVWCTKVVSRSKFISSYYKLAYRTDNFCHFGGANEINNHSLSSSCFLNCFWDPSWIVVIISGFHWDHMLFASFKLDANANIINEFLIIFHWVLFGYKIQLDNLLKWNKT